MRRRRCGYNEIAMGLKVGKPIIAATISTYLDADERAEIDSDIMDARGSKIVKGPKRFEACEFNQVADQMLRRKWG